mgnify:CR=1 FL=1
MMLTIDLFYIPTTISLVVVATIIGTSIWLNLPATRGQEWEKELLEESAAEKP